MPADTLDILKNWFTGTTVREVNWDNLRNPLMDWAESMNNNINQFRIDVLGSTYSYDNDGLANQSGPLRDFTTEISTLDWTFSGDITFTGTVVSDYLPPIGTIIPFYDFNGALTFNTNNWAYCDGSTKTVGSIGSQTLPDLSNRYLVGFGTEGGGDIDTAVWATDAIGNSNHQVNLAHTHTLSHTHGPGTLKFQIASIIAGGDVRFFDTNGIETQVITQNSANLTAGLNDDYLDLSAAPSQSYYTRGGLSGTNTDVASSSTTSSTLSTTQSIQPRSVRVRYLMRVL